MGKVLTVRTMWSACVLGLFFLGKLNAASPPGVGETEIPSVQPIRYTEDVGSGPILPIFGDDVRITGEYAPHNMPAIASPFFAQEIYCAFLGGYSGCPAVHIFKSTDDGYSWSPFGGVYTPGGEPLLMPSIVVTSSYVCLSYTFNPNPATGHGTVQTYRKPRSGGSGALATLPYNPAGWSDLAACQWDVVHLVLIYKYGPTLPEQVMVYYRSDDGGYTWGGEYTFSLGEGHIRPRIWYEIGSYPEWLYISRVGTGERFAKSTDGGLTWQTRTVELLYGQDMCGDGSGNILIFGYDGGVHKCVWSSNFGSSWQSYVLPSDLDGGISCDWMAGYFKAAGTSESSEVLYQSSTSATGFSGGWEVVSDMPTAFQGPSPAVCTDWDGFGLVAWVDQRDGVRTMYCDGEDWVGIEEEPPGGLADHADDSHLHQNSPNPFTSVTQMQYGLTSVADARLEVYDSAGQVVKTLVAGREEPGSHQVTWDGRNESGSRVAAGVYFYKLTAGDFTSTKKMVLVR